MFSVLENHICGSPFRGPLQATAAGSGTANMTGPVISEKRKPRINLNDVRKVKYCEE